jgi:outer membrane protein TolC
MSIGFKVLFLFCILVIQSTVLFCQSPSRSLEYFLGEATKYNPTIKDFRNQQQALKIDSLLLQAGRKPQITGNVAGMYAPIINGYGLDEVITNGQSLEALLNVNYELLNKKRIANQLQAIHIQRDSINYASSLSIYDLNKSIIEQYITAYASQQEVDFNLEIQELLKQEESLLKQLTRNNVYKQTEYLTFLVSLKQQELALKQAENQYKNDYAALNYLVGIADTTAVKLTEPKFDATSAIAGNSFFTKRFDIDSLKSVNQKAAIDFNYRPKLGIYANSGYSSSFTLQPYKNFGASVGFTLTVPNN